MTVKSHRVFFVYRIELYVGDINSFIIENLFKNCSEGFFTYLLMRQWVSVIAPIN